MLRRVVSACVALLVVLNCVWTPAASAGLISAKQEISIGKDVARQLEGRFGLADDPALQARVQRIGMNLVAVCDRKGLPYTFKVLKSKDVNAMAAPGGFIYVFQGLTDLMRTDDELAGVLGHELGHVVKKHSVHQMEKSLGMTLLFGVVFGGRGVALQSLALEAIMAGYSRDDEREADKLGFQQSMKAGYNPYGMLIGLEKLTALERGGGGDLFSDHPEGKARVALMRRYLAEAKIRPDAAETKSGAQVVDGAWRLPEIRAAADGNKPLYRAYLVAGRMYWLTRLDDYSPERYILDSDGVNVTVYYDDRPIMTVTPADAASYATSVEALANRYVDSLKQWPQIDKNLLGKM